MAIQIVTDSAADYSIAELERRGIKRVSMMVSFGEESYTDGVDISKDEFFERLVSEDVTPKTSQPSPASFLEIFEEAKEKGDDVIVILIASVLSGTYQTAVMAKEMAEYDRIFIVDSETATLGMRILADTAVNMRDQGKSAEEIVAELDSLKKRVVVYAGLNTLEYLYKGGRISKGVASIGALANIKPIIAVEDKGEVQLCSKQIGIRHAIKYTAKIVMNNLPDDNYPVYFIYSYDRSNCAGFIQALEKAGMQIDSPKIREIGPTIGSHIGPDAFGIVYVVKEKADQTEAPASEE